MQFFDVIVIGGGPAGLAAGLYATRARANTLLLEKAFLGGQAATTHWVENYPGFPEGVSGPELTDRMAAQASRLGLRVDTAEVLGMTASGNEIQLSTAAGEIRGRTVIVATGASPRLLNVPGEEELRGRGVSYCATCDGAFFHDKHVHVIGGGDSAAVEALFLTRFASRVTLVHRRSELRATKVLQEELLAHPKVEVVLNAVVREISGVAKVDGLKLEFAGGRNEQIASDGVFIYVGNLPNTGFLNGSIPVDNAGYILADARMRTKVRGIFAAGDCRDKVLRQIVTVVSDGATAAVEALEYLDRPNNWGEHA